MKRENTLWRVPIFIFLSILLLPPNALGKHPKSATVLTAVKTSRLITIDGIGDESEWEKAPPLNILIKDGTIGKVTVTMNALYDRDALYMLVRWADTKADVTKKQWVFDDTESRWVPSMMLNLLKQFVATDEDRFSIKWNIDDSVEGFNIAGCAMLCHGDRMHTNDPHERVDTWHWKASRTNPLGYADDKWLDDGVKLGFDEESREVARHGDRRDENAGISGMGGNYVENLRFIHVGEESIPAPWYWEPGATGDDAHSITQEEIINGEAVEIKDHLSINRKDPIPGYILFRPTGSRGDVDAKGMWENGIWTLEIKRKLRTGNKDDVQFDTQKLYRFGIAVHDNSEGFDGHSFGHSFDLGARTLEFGGTGSEKLTTMVLVQDYLLTALAYSKRKIAGLAHSQINTALAIFNEVQQSVADSDPKLFIDIKSSFVTAKRTPSPENIEALINKVDDARLLLQGKIEPSGASWSLKLLSWWGKVQAYVFIILGLLALIPIIRSTQIMKKEEFRVMGGFLFIIMTPIFLESLGRIGMLTRIRPLQNMSFMTSEYASFVWAVIVLFALFLAKLGFTELDAVIAMLHKAHDQLENRVAERTAELAEANEELRRQITERIWAEKALRESEEKLRFLSSHLLTAQERESRRISLELHDELGQSLTVLKLQVRSIERNLREDQRDLRGDCESTLQYVDQIIENVRRLSRDLSPSILEDLGLTAAIRWLIEDFAKHSNIKISIDMPGIDNLFSPDAQIILYRIFQEAFTNIGKHAQAANVSVIIRKEERSVSFLVEDDGKGFDIKQIEARHPTEKSLGLVAMDERARMLGGVLEISGQEGKGTRITFSIPIS